MNRFFTIHIATVWPTSDCASWVRWSVLWGNWSWALYSVSAAAAGGWNISLRQMFCLNSLLIPFSAFIFVFPQGCVFSVTACPRHSHDGHKEEVVVFCFDVAFEKRCKMQNRSENMRLTSKNRGQKMCSSGKRNTRGNIVILSLNLTQVICWWILFVSKSDLMFLQQDIGIVNGQHYLLNSN